MHDYWQKQNFPKPLFEDLLWNKPERRELAGKLAIIGGNKSGFSGVNIAFRAAKAAGVGEIKILVPDSLKKVMPADQTEIIFGASNSGGGFSRNAAGELHAINSWGDGFLLIGDNGKNTETAGLLEEFILKTEKPTVLARDTVDLLLAGMDKILNQKNIIIFASLAQLQKIFRTVYYPKMITFSMPLLQIVETIHKFTVSFPATIVTFHQNQIIISENGKVVSQNFPEPLRIWQGEIPARAASYILWSPQKKLEAVATSLIPD